MKTLQHFPGLLERVIQPLLLEKEQLEVHWEMFIGLCTKVVWVREVLVPHPQGNSPWFFFFFISLSLYQFVYFFVIYLFPIIIGFHSSTRTRGTSFLGRCSWISGRGSSISSLWSSVPGECGKAALMNATWMWKYRNVYWATKGWTWKWNGCCLNWDLVTWGSIKCLC